MELRNAPTRVSNLVTVYVAPDGAGWSVRVQGSALPVATFRLEADAMAYGRDYARRHQANLVVHFADGRVRFTERPMPRDPGE